MAISYTPNADYIGSDPFVVQVDDGKGGTDTITVNVTIDTPPVITEGDSTSVTISKNGSPIAFALTLHATDVNNDTLTWSISTPASHGTAGVPVSDTGASMAISYTPITDYTGQIHLSCRWMTAKAGRIPSR